MSTKQREWIGRIALLSVSLLVALAIAEFGLRLMNRNTKRLYIWQPNLQHTFHPDSTIFYGISGAKKFTINAEGFRGYEFDKQTRNYLCLGGSTTECLYLDDGETWWQLLADRLRDSVRIGSLGKSGVSTREHYIQAKYLLPQIENLHGVIIMCGINDLMHRLSRDTLFENNFRFDAAIEDSFAKAILLGEPNRGWRSFELAKLARTIYYYFYPPVHPWLVQDDRGTAYKEWRNNRKNASQIIDTLPDLSSALDEFERNLTLIAEQLNLQAYEVIFIDQAAIYRDSLTAFENDLLWMGGVGEFQKARGHAYYSAKALREGVRQYNKRLKDFCTTHHYKFIEISNALPSDTSVFYDDCHFHERGVAKLAEVLANSFIRR